MNSIFAKLWKPGQKSRTHKTIRTVSLQCETLEVRSMMSAISNYYDTHGGAAKFGAPKFLNEFNYQDGSGAYKDYEKGSIYYSKATNQAHAVLGASRDKFASLGGPKAFGFPTDDTHLVNAGISVTNFRKPDGSEGAIYSSVFGTYKLEGDLLAKYQSARLSEVGAPKSNPISGKGGSTWVDLQSTSGSNMTRLYSKPNKGTFYVRDQIRTKWISLGFENYGYPTSDTYGVNNIGQANNFWHVSNHGATIGYAPLISSDAHETHGVIQEAWIRNGGNKYEIPIHDEATGTGPAGRHMAYSTYQNLVTRWQTRYYLEDGKGVEWEISGRGENIAVSRQPLAPGLPSTPVNTGVTLVRHYQDDPIKKLSLATLNSDMYVSGQTINIDSSNSKNFVVTVDGVRSTYDLASITSINVVGNKSGSTLVINDRLRTPSGFLGYTIDSNSVSINSLPINYSTSIKSLTLLPSSQTKSAGSVTIRGDSAYTNITVGAPAIPYTVNVAFRDNSHALYSDVNVVGSSATTISAADYVSANPDISVLGSLVREVGVFGRVLFNSTMGNVTLHGDRQQATLRVQSKTTVPVNLIGGDGPTHFYVGNDLRGVDLVSGNITVAAGLSGEDVLTVNDVHAAATNFMKNYSIVGGLVFPNIQREVDSSIKLPNNATIFHHGLKSVELLTADQAPSDVRFTAQDITPAYQVNVQAGSIGTTVESEFNGFTGEFNLHGRGETTHLSLTETDLLSTRSTSMPASLMKMA